LFFLVRCKNWGPGKR